MLFGSSAHVAKVDGFKDKICGEHVWQSVLVKRVANYLSNFTGSPPQPRIRLSKPGRDVCIEHLWAKFRTPSENQEASRSPILNSAH